MKKNKYSLLLPKLTINTLPQYAIGILIIGAVLLYRITDTFDFLHVINVFSLIVPALFLIGSKYHFIKASLFSLLYTVIFFLITSMWIDYQNQPWFTIQSWSCDGPCYGWYTFENGKGYSIFYPIASLFAGFTIRTIIECGSLIRQAVKTVKL